MSEAGTKLRRDARDNREKLKVAARDVFLEQGLDAPLDDVARRAGVSIGTLYNRFGSREALIDAVVPEVAAARLGAVAVGVLELDGAWDRFAAFVRGVAQLQAEDRTLNDVVSRRYPDAPAILAVCDQALRFAGDLVVAAQEEGTLRAGFTSQDLFAILWMNALAARSAQAPDGWRRTIDYTIDGLRDRRESAPGDAP